MSKMSELSLTLDEMISCGEELIAAAKVMSESGAKLTKTAKAVREMFSNTAEPKTEAEPQEAKPSYTFADVRKAFSAKSHAGYTEQVKALIAKYGADKLSAVKEEDYPALMADLEAIV